jgi:sulfate-transporting ATPase
MLSNYSRLSSRVKLPPSKVGSASARFSTLSNSFLSVKPNNNIYHNSINSGVTQRCLGCHTLLARTFARVTPKDSSKEGNSQRYAYTLHDVSKQFATGRVLFKNVNLQFFEGAKIGILGGNGSGKSSLLKIIAGIEKEFDGKAFAAAGLKIGYLAQEPELNDDLTVAENVLEGIKDKHNLLLRYDEISAEFALPDADIDKLTEEQAELTAAIDKLNIWDLNSKIEVALKALNCPPGDSSVTNLSGGERRRVALCKLLLSEPDILLLDEPTNHLDADSVAWLENYLSLYRGLVIAITHDRYFLDKVAGYILEIDAGSLYPFKG